MADESTFGAAELRRPAGRCVNVGHAWALRTRDGRTPTAQERPFPAEGTAYTSVTPLQRAGHGHARALRTSVWRKSSPTKSSASLSCFAKA